MNVWNFIVAVVLDGSLPLRLCGLPSYLQLTRYEVNIVAWH